MEGIDDHALGTNVCSEVRGGGGGSGSVASHSSENDESDELVADDDEELMLLSNSNRYDHRSTGHNPLRRRLSCAVQTRAHCIMLVVLFVQSN